MLNPEYIIAVKKESSIKYISNNKIYGIYNSRFYIDK